MRPRAADLDSAPVGVTQMAGVPASLYVRLENREIVAMGNICCGSRVCKRKIQLSQVSIEICYKGGEKKLFVPGL